MMKFRISPYQLRWSNICDDYTIHGHWCQVWQHKSSHITFVTKTKNILWKFFLGFLISKIPFKGQSMHFSPSDIFILNFEYLAYITLLRSYIILYEYRNPRKTLDPLHVFDSYVACAGVSIMGFHGHTHHCVLYYVFTCHIGRVCVKSASCETSLHNQQFSDIIK